MTRIGELQVLSYSYRISAPTSNLASCRLPDQSPCKRCFQQYTLMPHALLIAPRSLPRLNAGFHVALSSYPFNLSTNASVALSFSKTWSVDARRKLSTPGGLQDPGELEDLGERISRLAFRYDHAKRARANRNGRLASQEWQEQHARSKPLISGGINDKLGRLKEDGQKAEYSRVKALVENLVLVEGYKPDASIYQALILANANAEHGSTREISQWLQDMDKADVALDSGIYHAVLKVQSAPIERKLPANNTTGSGCPSRPAPAR